MVWFFLPQVPCLAAYDQVGKEPVSLAIKFEQCACIGEAVAITYDVDIGLCRSIV